MRFKREASPIRIKGADADAAAKAAGGGGGGGGGGAYGGLGCGAVGAGQRGWTAVKPWPLASLVDEFRSQAHLQVDLAEEEQHPGDEGAGGDPAAAAALLNLTADFRECAEWALDGHCRRVPAFMQAHCGFFCQLENAWGSG
jgi:hypothetical protein